MLWPQGGLRTGQLSFIPWDALCSQRIDVLILHGRTPLVEADQHSSGQASALNFHVRLRREPVVRTIPNYTQNDAIDPKPKWVASDPEAECIMDVQGVAAVPSCSSQARARDDGSAIEFLRGCWRRSAR